MSPFELIEPASLAEAINLLDPEDPAVRPIAGGTAVLLMMRTGLFQPRRLISMRSIEPRFSRIAVGTEGELRIGAMASLAVIERSPEVRRHAPVIARALRRLSNIRVRNVATIGGHLAHADPHLDLPPVLVALGARLSIVGPVGERTIAMEELVAGYLETVLHRNELIAEVIIPPQRDKRAAYFKCTTRSADDWPALGIAVSLETDGPVVRNARLVVGAATDRPTRLAAAEAVLRDAHLDDTNLRRAGDTAAAEATLIGDQHGSAAFKRQLLRVNLGHTLQRALDPAYPDGDSRP